MTKQSNTQFKLLRLYEIGENTFEIGEAKFDTTHGVMRVRIGIGVVVETNDNFIYNTYVNPHHIGNQHVLKTVRKNSKGYYIVDKKRNFLSEDEVKEMKDFLDKLHYSLEHGTPLKTRSNHKDEDIVFAQSINILKPEDI